MKNSRDYIGGIGPGFNRKNEFLKRDHIKVGMANADCVSGIGHGDCVFS
jgi:hypothetical protein